VLTVGDVFPDYDLIGVVSTDPATAFVRETPARRTGRWRVVFFYPKDFTFVCPTEIAAFGRRNDAFADRGAQVLGVSVDSEYVHLAWKRDHPDLADLPYPLLSDVGRELTTAVGALGPDGVAQRATFVVDPDNVIQFSMVTADGVGRNPEEIIRVIDALHSGELCPANWRRGEATLGAAAPAVAPAALDVPDAPGVPTGEPVGASAS
jgi:peroxiredoxin (alkyl hydroperoxide reductase subunit C)